jgi:hypothetical protein
MFQCTGLVSPQPPPRPIADCSYVNLEATKDTSMVVRRDHHNVDKFEESLSAKNDFGRDNLNTYSAASIVGTADLLLPPGRTLESSRKRA